MHCNPEEEDKILEVLEQASKSIMEIAHKGASHFHTESKNDLSPVTAADLASHLMITKGLERIFPGEVCISEESEITKVPQNHWLLDPLDGTREFLKQNGEFTINLARIENGVCVQGFVALPEAGEIYFNSVHPHAKTTPSGGLGHIFLKRDSQKIEPCKLERTSKSLTILLSRSHGQKKEKEIFQSQFPDFRIEHMGSALKILNLALGKADLHVRLARLSEWDCAAAHCLLEASGGKLDAIDDTEIKYGSPKEPMRSFKAYSKKALELYDELNLSDVFKST